MRSLIIFLLLFSFSARAQNVRKDTISTTVIIFGDSEDQAPRKKDPKNIVKADLLGGAFGKTEFFYERHLTDFLSIQAGAGITYRNFVNGMYGSLLGQTMDDESPNWEADNEYNNFDDYGTYTGFEHRKGSLGYIASVIPKFYTGDDALEGFSLGLHLSYAQFRYKAQKILPNGDYSDDEFQKEKVNSLRFTLDISGQSVFKPLTLEYGIGVGLTKDKETRLDTGYQYNGFDNIYVNKTHTFGVLRPLFNLFLILGGGF